MSRPLQRTLWGPVRSLGPGSWLQSRCGDVGDLPEEEEIVGAEGRGLVPPPFLRDLAIGTDLVVFLPDAVEGDGVEGAPAASSCWPRCSRGCSEAG